MKKIDKLAITFIVIFLISVGFVLGYFAAGANIEPEIVEKEVIKYVEVEVEKTPDT